MVQRQFETTAAGVGPRPRLMENDGALLLVGRLEPQHQ